MPPHHAFDHVFELSTFQLWKEYLENLLRDAITATMHKRCRMLHAEDVLAALGHPLLGTGRLGMLYAMRNHTDVADHTVEEDAMAEEELVAELTCDKDADECGGCAVHKLYSYRDDNAPQTRPEMMPQVQGSGIRSF